MQPQPLFPSQAGAPTGLPRPRAMRSLWATPVPVEPPSERVLAAVLQFGDIREEREDGTVMIRFSGGRLDREDLRLLLDDERERAEEVSILWDEAEAQVLEVMDAGPLRAGRRRGPPAPAYAGVRRGKLALVEVRPAAA